MKSFHEYLSEQDAYSAIYVKPKLWKASKKNVLQYWKTLRDDTPLTIRPLQYSHKGSTYGEDGIRITGSHQFIGSILGRIKELLNYENPQTKLMIAYRQVDKSKKTNDLSSQASYAFYVNVKDRGDKNPLTP